MGMVRTFTPRSTARLNMQKFYVLDPGVGNELGGLRVQSDDDKKGRFVLAVPLMVQYWIDQGTLSDKPFSELSASHKKLLAQVTRGRSEDPDKDPTPVPRYNAQTQAGAPIYAHTSIRSMTRAKRKKAKAAAAKKNGKNGKPPAPPTTVSVAPKA